MSILIALLALSLAWGSASAADEADTASQARTRELLSHMREARTPDETEIYQQEILAWGDSLEAATEFVLASHCLERAGQLSYFAGDYTRAQEIWSHGLEVARRSEDPKRIGSLMNAVVIGVSSSGDNVRAIGLYHELIEFRATNDDQRGVGVALSNLAFSQVALFQYPEAIATLRRAIAVHRDVENRSGIAHAQLTLSELLAHAGRSDEAAALADSAVTNSRILESPQRLAPALHVRALRNVTGGRHEAALVDFNESIALLEQYSLLTMIGATVVNRADVLVSLDRAEQAVTDLQGTLPQVDEGMNPAQSITARGTLGRALLHIGEPDQARAILKDGIQRFFAFADSLADAPQRANANIVAIPLSVLPLLELAEGRSAEAWRIVESGLARQLRRSLGSTEQIVSLEEFQATLSHLDASALIVGVNSSEGSPLLLIGPDSIQGTNLKLSAGISRDLSSTIDLIAADSAPTMLAAPLERLSEQVRAGLSELFRSEHHRLIVMSGGWGGFPFELLEDQDGQLLGDRYDISYAPSATVLISLEGRQRAGIGFLALADPVSAPQTLLAGTAVAMRAAAEPRPPLPQAREEAKHIAPRGGRIALGAEATPSLLLEAGGQASVLHLAMHARVDVQHPGASALLMSPDDAFAHGVLAADDIAAASMKADLVSLSGCSTVGGYRVLGEGTFGLVRAFLEAGARTVVASRWDVEDAAARRFMELFYAQLATGAARDDALATARRTMRDEGYGYRDRAAFALVGAVSGELPVLRSEDGRGMLPLALVLFAFALLAGVLVWQTRARASRRS